jgi:valyl-tRNA synthetase
MRRLGASLDWSRTCFTLDAGFSTAVQQAFVTLFDQGRIYRADRIVNWCPALQSALSDVEVDTLELTGPRRLTVPSTTGDVTALFGVLHSVAFPHATRPDVELRVATTRPETLPGDVALAVHPTDLRYADWVGQFVRHPVTGVLLPVVADEAVQPEFGSGVVKVTPAHDAFDFELGKRHGLTIQHVIGKDGCMLDGKWCVNTNHDQPKQYHARITLLQRPLCLKSCAISHAWQLGKPLFGF